MDRKKSFGKWRVSISLFALLALAVSGGFFAFLQLTTASAAQTRTWQIVASPNRELGSGAGQITENILRGVAALTPKTSGAWAAVRLLRTVVIMCRSGH